MLFKYCVLDRLVCGDDLNLSAKTRVKNRTKEHQERNSPRSISQRPCSLLFAKVDRNRANYIACDFGVLSDRGHQLADERVHLVISGCSPQRQTAVEPKRATLPVLARFLALGSRCSDRSSNIFLKANSLLLLTVVW